MKPLIFSFSSSIFLRFHLTVTCQANESHIRMLQMLTHVAHKRHLSRNHACRPDITDHLSYFVYLKCNSADARVSISRLSPCAFLLNDTNRSMSLLSTGLFVRQVLARTGTLSPSIFMNASRFSSVFRYVERVMHGFRSFFSRAVSL